MKKKQKEKEEKIKKDLEEQKNAISGNKEGEQNTNKN